MYIVIAIIAFGILITVHEAGHFLAAKLCGVKVVEFAIGMGPKIFKRQGSETLFTLRALPIGGYCAMEEDEESSDPRAFTNQKGYKKLLILAAGSIMNFIFGFLLLLALVNPASFRTPTITSFFDECPYVGEDALMEGDTFYKVNGERIYFSSHVSFYLSRGGDTADIEIIRNGEKIVLNDFHMVRVEMNDDGQMKPLYGLRFENTETGATARLKCAWYQAADYVRIVRISLADLFSGAAGIRDLSGPVGLVSVMNDVAQESPTAGIAILNILSLVAFIAINLATMNLLPIPALDGGRILFLFIHWVVEKIARRRVSPKYEGYVHAAFMIALLGLMAFVMINDVVRIVTGA